MTTTLLATTVANKLIKKVSKTSGAELPLQTFIKDDLTFHFWVEGHTVYVKVYNEEGELLEVRQPL